MTYDESTKVVQERAEKLTALLLLHRTTFSLDAPTQLTVKYPDGSYKKKPFIGEEALQIESFYVGKAGKMIAVFKVLEHGGFELRAEMMLHDAGKNLAGFNAWLNTMLDRLENETLDEARSDAETKEEAAHRAAELLLSNPLYGSW
jgi:hypothetical protein